MKSILQTKQWADFKASQGFEILELDDIFVHKRKLPLGQNFLYLPEVSAKQISPSQVEELKKLAKEHKSIFARLEVLDEFSDNAHKLIKSFGFKKAFEEVQPKWRQIIDLTKTEDEILAEMKQKGRYNLRLAERSGVTINQKSKTKDQNDKSKLKDFYTLYSETVSREKITGRSLEYFQKLLDSFEGTDYIEIYIAEFQGKPVAGALISFYDGVASYLYGGSSREHKEVMASSLMHFQIIKDAKARGMKTYDLLGRSAPAPTSNAVEVPTASVGNKSGWAGLTRFKEQFGGRAYEMLGSYDFVNKPLFYQMFMMAEKLRR